MKAKQTKTQMIAEAAQQMKERTYKRTAIYDLKKAKKKNSKIYAMF